MLCKINQLHISAVSQDRVDFLQQEELPASLTGCPLLHHHLSPAQDL